MEQLLTTEGVAAYLQVAEKTVRNWRSRGEGPSVVRVGGAIRYRKADIDRWLDENAEPPSRVSVAKAGRR
jgi:excisionase family DNA binding protein